MGEETVDSSESICIWRWKSVENFSKDVQKQKNNYSLGV